MAGLNDLNTNLTIFPDVPQGAPVTSQSGQLSEEFRTFFANTSNSNRKHFRPYGFYLPQIDNAAINYVKNYYAPYIGQALPSGVEDLTGLMAVLITTTNPVFKVFNISYNGSGIVTSADWKTITVT